MFKFRLRKSQKQQSRQDFEFEYLLFFASAIQAAERQQIVASAMASPESLSGIQSEDEAADASAAFETAP